MKKKHKLPSKEGLKKARKIISEIKDYEFDTSTYTKLPGTDPRLEKIKQLEEELRKRTEANNNLWKHKETEKINILMAIHQKLEKVKIILQDDVDADKENRNSYYCVDEALDLVKEILDGNYDLEVFNRSGAV